MKYIKYFTFFLGLWCANSSVKCIEKKESEQSYGYLKYDKYVLEKCEQLLPKITDLDSCELKPTSGLNLRLAEELQCKTSTSTCPPSPTDACVHDGSPPSDTDKFCFYTCTEEILACPSDSPANRNFVDSSAAFCFNLDIDQCEYKTTDTNSSTQLDYSCDRRPCGYLASIDGFTSTMKFDGSNFINEYVADSSQTDDFGCTGTSYQSSCTCYENSVTKTTLTWPELAYTSKCEEDSCVDNKCYKDKPILDSKSDYCSNLIGEYDYCSRELKVRRPCGDLPHLCAIPPGETFYNCKCTVSTENECPDGALWTKAENGNAASCDFVELPLELPMSTCEKTCFNETLSVKTC